MSIIYRRPHGDVNRRKKQRRGGVFRPADWVKADGNKAYGWLYSLALRDRGIFAKGFPDDFSLIDHPNVTPIPHLGAAAKEDQQRAGLEVVKIFKERLS